jgi:hypothetical protein
MLSMHSRDSFGLGPTGFLFADGLGTQDGDNRRRI